MPSQTTRDHEEIQRWAREHGACPAVVSRTGGMLRFEFDPAHAQQLTQVDWDDFFSVFDRKGLELVYDDKPGSRFHKIVYPETVAAKARRQPARKPARSGQRMNLLGAAGKLGRGGAGATRNARAGAGTKGKTTGRSTGRATATPGGGRGRAAAASSSGRSRSARTTASRAKAKSSARGRRTSTARKAPGTRSGRTASRRRAS